LSQHAVTPIRKQPESASLPQLTQAVSATSTHAASHSIVQQSGATAHTAVQQAVDEQKGDPCGKKHPPVPGLPHAPQFASAMSTHA
jgi:hypothetical protein